MDTGQRGAQGPARPPTGWKQPGWVGQHVGFPQRGDLMAGRELEASLGPFPAGEEREGGGCVRLPPCIVTF